LAQEFARFARGSNVSLQTGAFSSERAVD